MMGMSDIRRFLICRIFFFKAYFDDDRGSTYISLYLESTITNTPRKYEEVFKCIELLNYKHAVTKQ